MKKFIFILFLLIAIGGTVFFIGWTHLTVPPGSFGVMISKSHGMEERVIHDGDFSWLWYKLIPTNTEIRVFNIRPHRKNIHSSGSLISGQTYSTLAGLDADFTWEISGELSFSIRPEILPGLVRSHYLVNDDDLRNYESDLATRIETMLLGRVKTLADSGNQRAIESLLLTGSLPELETEIQRAFSQIENLHITFRVLRLPDFSLYQSVMALYNEYLQSQSVFLNEELLREAQTRINTRIRLDLLSQYGRIMTEYPILLDFLAMDLELIGLFLDINQIVTR